MAGFVLLDEDDVALAALHALLLLAEGAEEVFHQSPVQEGAILVGPGDLQEGKLTHLGQRMLGGGDDTLVLVEIDEHFQHVAVVHLRGDIALRQEDVACLLVTF